ncbi:thioesterase family protein [Glutamicibacter sp.]|uniref:thioesterase family protein n=1 Tax=Glutamicibacter sp. TaxID=1931995 RepID=UPI0028BD69CF|nr:thioesterase family protein [Glutamicibacter sp.]
MNTVELSDYRAQVLPEWIDYNGHMSEAYYVLAFGDATTAVMDQLGMDAAYREASGSSLYTVEAHVRYLLEASLGQELRIRSTIAGHGAKKLHLCHEMYRGEELIATEEVMTLHVDQSSSSTSPFPEDIAQAIAGYSQHRPEWSGRAIAS